MVPFLMSGIIIRKHSGGQDSAFWEQHSKLDCICSYTTWYSNIVGFVSYELEETNAKFTR